VQNFLLLTLREKWFGFSDNLRVQFKFMKANLSLMEDYSAKVNVHSSSLKYLNDGCWVQFL